jgi:hypothetical protein
MGAGAAGEAAGEEEDGAADDDVVLVTPGTRPAACIAALASLTVGIFTVVPRTTSEFSDSPL